MHLNTHQTRHLAELLALLTQPMGGDALRQALAEPIAELLDADYVASYVWDAEDGRFGRGLCSRADPGHLRRYEAEYQFDDPITGPLHRCRYPTLVTQVMPQRELVRTEFFDRFLKTDGLYWGVNLYAHDGVSDLGDLRIWRRRSKQNFDANELELLRLLYPALVGSLSRASADPWQAPTAQTESSQDVWARLSSLHRLSTREAEVAQMAAAGCPDKEIARRAGIGFTTVRTHLMQVLRKTGCSNRKQLIHYVAHAAGRL
jgi:DNA-binding CsgD family transcriptional regulator